MIYDKPIRHIGGFYAFLKPESQKRARNIARNAHRLPKHVIDRAVNILEKEFLNGTGSEGVPSTEDQANQPEGQSSDTPARSDLVA